MKKNFIYILLALATVSFAACDDDYTDWAAPQQNAEEAAQSVSFSAANASAINFADITEGDAVKAFTPTFQAEEGATATYELTFADGSVVKADEEGQISSSDLRTVIENIYGKRPVERSLPATVAAYVTVNGQAIKKTADITVTATLTAPVIESAYYYVGQSNGWSLYDDTYIFSRSDKDVYEDPAFTVVVPAPYDDNGNRVDMWFKIVPLSSHNTDNWDGLLGCASDGDTSLSGKLYVGGGSMKMPADDGAKMYKIVLDMMEYTYTVTPLSFSEYIYVVGNPSWNVAAGPALRSAAFDGKYIGYANLDGGFKFVKERGSWDGQYNSGDFTTYNGGCADAGQDGNMTQPTAGYYYIVADVPNSTLTTTLITSWGIIGTATAGGWDSDTDMTWNAADETWTLTTELTAGELKFRANDGWDINLGGDSIDDLVENGANLQIAEAGTYTITLYTTRSASNKIYCTIAK
jgi:hypothetical protein